LHLNGKKKERQSKKINGKKKVESEIALSVT